MRVPDLLPQSVAAAPPEPEPAAPPADVPSLLPRDGNRSHLQMASPRSATSTGPELRAARPGSFSSAAGAMALEQATAKLTRGLTHPVITDGDAAAVLELLTPLDREALLHTLTGLEGRGLLSRFLEEQDGTTRDGFLALLLERRVLAEGASNPAPVGPLGPPTLPPTLATVPTHLPSLEVLAHGENVQRARAYGRERAAYLERFVEMVGEASTQKELELLGQPLRKERFETPGYSEEAIRRTRSLNDLTSAGPEDRVRVFSALSDRKLLLEGERPAMSLRATFSASLTEDAKLARQLGVSGTLGPEGLRVQPEIGMSAEGASLKVQAPADEGGLPVVSVGLRVGTVGASFGTDGTLKLEAGPVRVDTSPDSGQVGVGIGTPIGRSPFEISAGISLQLSDPNRAASIAWGRGAPDAPAALSQGRRWDALPPEQRAALETTGIRGTFWDALIDAAEHAPEDS
jgi:hypothetical protein